MSCINCYFQYRSRHIHSLVFAAVLIAVLSFVLFPADAVRAEYTYEEVSISFSNPDVYIQVLPRMELVAGVLTQTSWMEEWGPSEGNSYFHKVRDEFSSYDEHRAVEIAEELLEKRFIHDALPHLAFRLSPLPNLLPRWGYGQNLIHRAGGTDLLEEFRRELIDLADKMDFHKFFAKHGDLYEDIVHELAAELDSKKIIPWLHDFFGWSGDEYYLIAAPSMFPGGGYGGHVRTPEGEMLVTQVIRAEDDRRINPRFPTGESLQRLSLHEWGHSFVDPTLAQHPLLVRQLEFLYKPVEHVMKDQAYTNVATFVNEQVLRAIETLAMKDLYGSQAYYTHKSRTERRGFYLTEPLIELFQNKYLPRRDSYADFSDFAPTLLGEMSEMDPPSAFSLTRIPWRHVPYLLLGFSALCAILWWAIWGLRYRKQQIENMTEGKLPDDIPEEEQFDGKNLK